jgi:hypothetical protein
MKIYKIAEEFTVIPQNPTREPDPDITLQNLQQAQMALEETKKIEEAATAVNNAVRNLEEILGVTTNMAQDISNSLTEALPKNNAVQTLQRTNVITNPLQLLDQNTMDIAETKLVNDISKSNAQAPSPDIAQAAKTKIIFLK